MSHYDCMSCGVGPFTPHLKSCSENKPVKSKKRKKSKRKVSAKRAALADARTENARLSAHHDKVCDDRELIWNQRDEARAELADAKAEIKRLRKALDFYADVARGFAGD